MGATTSSYNRPVDYDFPWDQFSRRLNSGITRSSGVVAARRVEVGMGAAETVVCRSLKVGMAKVEEAFVFDDVNVGMSTVDELHCLRSTTIKTGFSSIKKTVYHTLPELVQLARSKVGLAQSTKYPPINQGQPQSIAYQMPQTCLYQPGVQYQTPYIAPPPPASYSMPPAPGHYVTPHPQQYQQYQQHQYYAQPQQQYQQYSQHPYQHQHSHHLAHGQHFQQGQQDGAYIQSQQSQYQVYTDSKPQQMYPPLPDSTAAVQEQGQGCGHGSVQASAPDSDQMPPAYSDAANIDSSSSA